MATIYDLIEVTSISANTTYSEANGNLLGVVDGANGPELDDGEFDEGDLISIGGTTYTIDLIQEPSSSGSFLLGDGSTRTFSPQNEDNLELKAGFLEPLKKASKDLQAAGMFFMQNGMKNPNAALAGSYDFMHLFGHVCLGLMWAQMGKAALTALEAGADDETFYRTKLTTGRYYMQRRLPATALHLARINSGADTVMELEAANF